MRGYPTWPSCEVVSSLLGDAKIGLRVRTFRNPCSPGIRLVSAQSDTVIRRLRLISHLTAMNQNWQLPTLFPSKFPTRRLSECNFHLENWLSLRVVHVHSAHTPREWDGKWRCSLSVLCAVSPRHIRPSNATARPTMSEMRRQRNWFRLNVTFPLTTDTVTTTTK